MFKRIVFTDRVSRQRLCNRKYLFPRGRRRARRRSDRQRNLGRTQRARQNRAANHRALISARLDRFASLGFVGEAQAQEADINVSNPAIRALKDSIKQRSGAIKPYMDRGNIGIAQDGMLAVRNTDGIDLKARAEINQLVDAENRDRETLYAEIAKANGIPSQQRPEDQEHLRQELDRSSPTRLVDPGRTRKLEEKITRPTSCGRQLRCATLDADGQTSIVT